MENKDLFLVAGLGLLSYYLYEKNKSQGTLGNVHENIIDGVMPLIVKNPFLAPLASNLSKKIVKNSFKGNDIIDAEYTVIKE